MIRGANIRHEAQQQPDDPPQHRRRHADQEQADAGDHPERGVDAKLDQEIPRQAARGVVHRRGGAMQVGRAEQADQAVAQILPLQQHEDRHDQHDGGRRQRIDDRRDHPFGDLHWCRVRFVDLHLHRLLLVGVFRGLRLRCGRRVELLAQAAHDHVRAARCEALDGVDLGPDRRGVAGHILRQVGDLGANEAAQRHDDAQREQDGNDHRQHAAQVDAAQQVDDGRQQKRQQYRQGNRYQDGAAQI
jgi:hypothetical protein